ncbi:ATP-binding cassette domain-containing protein [Microbacterium sp. CIAB417]|uniref:ATP-binding cassette domain-containing protein n=1 Tax=Microbacterium sp. CIAB417 TaxID=2860287 RepID=UPI001FADF9F3|nr:ATP-binding cassette domain-containing protein [Microbacterium sp. CIAB417]
MPDGQVLEFDRVTKRFGDVTAVSDFSGRVEPGVVTGFLGPNGAGKTTTLRMLLGQIRPASGTATIGGAQFAELKHPARVIGAMHEDPGFRPRRTVERHLVLAAKANGVSLSRVAEVVSFVGLDGEADSRIGTLSLGMRQRLSAATALLGDPGALVLDEPANGLDPEGIRWMRMLIRGLADEGRTVLVSSHVLSEVEQVADEILVISRGQRKFAGSLASLADPSAGPVVVDAADRGSLTDALTSAGFDFEVLRSGLTVRGSDAKTIGAVAARAGVALTTLQQRGPTLEDVFLDLVNDRPVQLRKPEPADVTTALPLAGATGTPAPVEDLSAQSAPDEPAAANETAAVAEAADETAEVDEAVAAEPPAATADGDEDEVAADESAPLDAFAPVSAADDRPLPGAAGLAVAAAGLAAPDDTAPVPVVSDAWAALISGRPVDGSEEPADGDAEAQPEHAAPEEAAPNDALPSPSESVDGAIGRPDEFDAAEPEYTESAHEQHVAESEQAAPDDAQPEAAQDAGAHESSEHPVPAHDTGIDRSEDARTESDPDDGREGADSEHLDGHDDAEAADEDHGATTDPESATSDAGTDHSGPAASDEHSEETRTEHDAEGPVEAGETSEAERTEQSSYDVLADEPAESVDGPEDGHGGDTEGTASDVITSVPGGETDAAEEFFRDVMDADPEDAHEERPQH